MSQFTLMTAFPESTAITRAAYHPDRAMLDVWYEGGDRYSYFRVPLRIYRQLCVAPSAGEFVNREIKPNYEYEVEPRKKRFRPID